MITYTLPQFLQYFFSKTPYYFFVALSNCDTNNDRNLASSNVMYTQGSVDVKVDLLMTNGNTLNSRHFSADKIGVFGTSITFFIIQVRAGFSSARRCCCC